MKKLAKILGGVCLGALTAGLIPFRFKRDRESGSFEVGSLLWAVKKTPGEEKDTYTVELLPGIGGKDEPAADAAAPEEERFAEIPLEDDDAEDDDEDDGKDEDDLDDTEDGEDELDDLEDDEEPDESEKK